MIRVFIVLYRTSSVGEMFSRVLKGSNTKGFDSGDFCMVLDKLTPNTLSHSMVRTTMIDERPPSEKLHPQEDPSIQEDNTKIMVESLQLRRLPAFVVGHQNRLSIENFDAQIIDILRIASAVIAIATAIIIEVRRILTSTVVARHSDQHCRYRKFQSRCCCQIHEWMNIMGLMI